MKNPEVSTILSEVSINRTILDDDGDVYKQGLVSRSDKKTVAWISTNGDNAFTFENIIVCLGTGKIEHTYYYEPFEEGRPVEVKLEDRFSALSLLGRVKEFIMDGENPDKQKVEEVLSLIQESVETYYAL